MKPIPSNYNREEPLWTNVVFVKKIYFLDIVKGIFNYILYQAVKNPICLKSWC